MKIFMGAIHHGDKERTSAQAARVARVVDGLTQAGFSVLPVVDSWFQPSLSSSASGFGARLRATTILFQQEKFSMFEFRRRRGNTARPSARKWWRLLRHVAESSFERKAAQRIARQTLIEQALTEKHIFLWAGLANSEADGALIFEDDFEIPTGSTVGVLAGILQKYGASTDLIDLAGGYSRKELGLPEAPGQDLELDLLVANTTCAYFIGKSLAERLVHLAMERPRLKILGADFFIPYVNRDQKSWKTVLPAELPFVHGSFHGSIPSSIRN